jgi:DNA polymerase delta subunit 2
MKRTSVSAAVVAPSGSSGSASSPGVEKRTFKNNQYGGIYNARLKALRPAALAAGARKWEGKGAQVATDVLSATTVRGEDGAGLVVVAGTVFRAMPLVPRLLTTFAEERGVAPLPEKQSGARTFISAEDEVFLEDGVGRIQLAFPPSENATKEKALDRFVVTGVIAAILGRIRDDGVVEVLDVTFAGIPPQTPPFVPQALPRRKGSTGLAPGHYIALVSGLEIGQVDANLAHRQLLLEFLCGSGGSAELQESVARIGRVIIAGNSLTDPASAAKVVRLDDDAAAGDAAAEAPSTRSCVLNDPAVPYEAQETRILTEAVQELDSFLAQLAVSVAVDIMPGMDDPSPAALPQPPLNRFLFPVSSQFTTLRSIQNPCELRCSVKGGGDGQGGDSIELSVVGSSGEPIHNLMQFAQNGMTESAEDDVATRLDLLEQLLFWRHLAPTAPTELGCYPFEASDPFVLERCPEIFFAGTQPSFATRLCQGWSFSSSDLIP